MYSRYLMPLPRSQFRLPLGGLILRELQQLLAKNFKLYGLNFKALLSQELHG